MSKERPIVIGSCWTNFCSQKLKSRILAIFGFNSKALHATQPKLHSMFCVLFLKIALSVAELISFGHLGAAIWHRWTIICVMLSKISVTPTSQRQLTLKKTIFVKPFVKYSCTQSIMCLKIGPRLPCRLLYGQPSQPFEWNYFPLLIGRIVILNKKKEFKKIFSSFLGIFQKRKVYYVILQLQFCCPLFRDKLKIKILYFS